MLNRKLEIIDDRFYVVIILLIFVILYNNFPNLGMSRLNNTKLNKVYKNIFINRKFTLIMLFVIVILTSIVFMVLNGINFDPEKDKKDEELYSFSTVKNFY